MQNVFFLTALYIQYIILYTMCWLLNCYMGKPSVAGGQPHLSHSLLLTCSSDSIAYIMWLSALPVPLLKTMPQHKLEDTFSMISVVRQKNPLGLTSRRASRLGRQVAPGQGGGRGRLEAVAATRRPSLVIRGRRARGHSVKRRLLAHTQTWNTQN